jgi:hypothetical protein
MILKKLKGPNNRAVNLHHPTLRNCVMTFTMFTRKYPSPYPCPTCRIDHEYKTVHLNLNNDGDAVINEPLYQKLKDQGLLGELKATHETVPLPTVLDMGVSHPAPIVMSREVGAVRLGMNGGKLAKH